FKPTDEQIKTLQACVERFNGSGYAKTKQKVARAFLPVCAVLLLATVFLPISFAHKFQLAAGVIGFACLTPFAYLMISGLSDRTYLFTRVREFFLEGGIVALFCWLGGIALFACALFVLNVHWEWLIALVAAIGAAWAFHSLIDPSISDDRIDPMARAEALLKSVRRAGVSEACVQQFVCKNAGEHWEEFYEALFGYESKILARKEWGRIEALDRKGKGDRGRPRPKFAAWRDPIIQWIDARQEARREARDRKHLEIIERANFKAKGFPEAAAQKKARSAAMSIVVSAAELRELAKAHLLDITVAPAAADDQAKSEAEKEGAGADEQKKRKKPVLDDDGLEGFEKLSYFQRRYGGWAGFFLGPPVRFILGAILVACCLTWASNNDLLPTQSRAANVKQDVASALDSLGSGGRGSAAPRSTESGIKDLELSFAPSSMTHWLSGWQVGVAGLILVISTFITAPKIGLFALPAALVAILGVAVLPNIGPIPAWLLSSLAGAALAFMGFRIMRD
ncbi:MAG TPA: hypothetical protein VH518_03680, partial [Tepidisphaeraceae bacterium]